MSADPLTKYPALVAAIEPGYRMIDGTLLRMIYQHLGEAGLAATTTPGPQLVNCTELRFMATKIGVTSMVDALQEDGERLIDGTVFKQLALDSAAPINVDAPAITGTPTVGSTLTVTMGNWTGAPGSYSYQWKNGSTNVGTNSSTYVVQAGDTSITCVVTATNAAGSAAATSNAVAILVAPTNTAEPVITGTGAVGQTLTASTGTWTGSPTSYSYQWKRLMTNIGTNSSTYVVQAADSGQDLAVIVTATNAAGSTVGPPSLTIHIA